MYVPTIMHLMFANDSIWKKFNAYAKDYLISIRYLWKMVRVDGEFWKVGYILK